MKDGNLRLFSEVPDPEADVEPTDQKHWYDDPDNEIDYGRVSLLVGLAPRPGSPEREAYEAAIAADRLAASDRLAAVMADIAALQGEAEARIYDLVRTCRRLTGDHQTDFREITHALDFIEDTEKRFGRSDVTDRATVVLCNAGGEVWMRHLTGHGPPYTQAEHNQKDALREDIDHGRRQGEFVRRDDR